MGFRSFSPLCLLSSSSLTISPPWSSLSPPVFVPLFIAALTRSYIFSSVFFFEPTHIFPLLSLCLFLTTWWVFLRLHTSHPYLWLPSSTDFNYCFLPEAVSLSLLSLLYNVSCCLFFFFHQFRPDWILPLALLHLYNKAYILGYTLSTKLPSNLESFSFFRYDHISFICQNIVNYNFIYTNNCSTPWYSLQATNEIYEENRHSAGVQENCSMDVFRPG